MKYFYRKIVACGKRMLSGWVLLMCVVAGAMAQRSTIQGTVTDAADGSPLIGASVLIKSTSTGTIVDAEGRFSLEANPDDVLVVSFIGYNTEEVPVGGRTSIAITLTMSSTSLDEIVVVGFGEQRKANLSGAVDVIDNKVLEARPIQNIAQGLQGTIPNHHIHFLSGEPGGWAQPKSMLST